MTDNAKLDDTAPLSYRTLIRERKALELFFAHPEKAAGALASNASQKALGRYAPERARRAGSWGGKVTALRKRAHRALVIDRVRAVGVREGARLCGVSVRTTYRWLREARGVSGQRNCSAEYPVL